MTSFRLGVNLYGLAKPFGKDKVETLQELKAMGFDCIEPMLILMQPNPNHAKPKAMPPQLWFPETMETEAALVRACGMDVESMHVAVRRTDYEAAELAKQLECAFQKTGARYYIINCAYRTREEALDWAAFLSEVQTRLPQPVQVLAHNHNMEFYPTGDAKRPYILDLFTEATSNVGMEIDYGWTWYAGLSFEEVQKYNDHAVLVHLKDFRADIRHKVEKQAENDEFLPIGTGAVYNREVIANLKNLPHFAGLVIIDQDYDPDIMSALRIGAKRVKEIKKNV